MEHSADTPRAALQRQILERLLRLETLTTELLTCPEEQLTDRLNGRQALMDEIHALTECTGTAAPDGLDGGVTAADNSPDTVPAGSADADSSGDETLRELMGQCRAAACRMQQLDQQAVARLQTMQQRVLEKIRAVGKSAGAQAARFYTPAPSGSTFHGNI